MINDLSGKRVLITGASKGIGAALAQGFAAHGAHVAIHYNSDMTSAKKLLDGITEAGGTAYLLQADLQIAAQAGRVVTGAADVLGGLDVLVNNAGAMCGRVPFGAWDDDLYERVMSLNVRSVLEACQAVLPIFEASSGGNIVNVGSIAGNNGGGPGSGHYACAKAYIHNLTRHMAIDLAPKNIRVNAIAPGVVETDFHRETPPDRMQAMKNSVPLGRAGTPADCVGPVLFLASNECSAYITGQIIHVNGGQLLPA